MLTPRPMSLGATKYKENKEAKSHCMHATLRKIQKDRKTTATSEEQGVKAVYCAHPLHTPPGKQWAK